ncbi:MAG TPA: oligopeptide:H+ symporter [Caulobacteraceae bacterium]|jgi:POT family proton-dependent oligopeptide transporter
MNIVIIAGIIVTLVTGIPVLLQLLKNHPKGLFILFFAEMWERFSYYGMRGLLIFYLTQHFLFSDEFSNSQYGSYTSLVYLLPLVGGLIADRYLGTRKAIAFGAVLLTIGQLAMALTPTQATQTLSYGGQAYQIQSTGRGGERENRLMVGGQAYEYASAEGGGLQIKGLPPGGVLPAVLPAGSYQTAEQRDPAGVNLFYLALALIIMGVGFLKPNISTIVGQLYKQGDPRRDAGFTLYYYGINLGAFWAAVLCGYLGQTVGWWAGFGLAGVGMALGFIVFVLGKPWLEGNGEPPDPERLRQKVAGPLSREYLIYLLAILGVGGVFFLVRSNQLVGVGLGLSIVAAMGFIAWFMITKCDKIQRERMMLAMVLIFGAVVFFTLFEQAGTSLNLFADRNVDLAITGAAKHLGPFVLGTREQIAAAGGASVPGIWIDTGITASQTQSFNAGYILIFAPIFAALWTFLGRRKRDPNPTMKFGLGLVQVGFGFMVVVIAAKSGMVGADFRLPLLALGLLYLFHTTGELFLSPVGLSEITKLSVASVVSFMMAVWFLASSIAQYVGGWIAGMAGTETVGGQVLDSSAALQSSLKVFNMLGLWGMGIGLAFIAASFFIKHWAHGINDPQDMREDPEPLAPTVDGERQAVTPQILRDERADPDARPS